MDTAILFTPQITLFFLSAIFFSAATLLMIKPLKNSRGDRMIISLTAYLAGMALFHVFWAISIIYYTSQTIHFVTVHLGVLFALLGSAMTFRIFLHFLAPLYEKTVFYLVLLTGVVFEIWMVFVPHSDILMNWFVFLYMVIFAGSTGIFLMLYSLKLDTFNLRLKAFGAGTGIAICCLVADIFVLAGRGGAVAEFLMALSPVIVIASVFSGRRLAEK